MKHEYASGLMQRWDLVRFHETLRGKLRGRKAEGEKGKEKKKKPKKL
jgi:hypothetical protein